MNYITSKLQPRVNDDLEWFSSRHVTNSTPPRLHWLTDAVMSRFKQLVAVYTAAAASTTHCSHILAPIRPTTISTTPSHVPTPLSTVITAPPALQLLVDASLAQPQLTTQMLSCITKDFSWTKKCIDVKHCKKLQRDFEFTTRPSTTLSRPPTARRAAICICSFQKLQRANPLKNLSQTRPVTLSRVPQHDYINFKSITITQHLVGASSKSSRRLQGDAIRKHES